MNGEERAPTRTRPDRQGLVGNPLAETKTRDPQAARILLMFGRSGEVEANLGPAAAAQGRTDNAEAEDHQRPGRRLRNGGNRFSSGTDTVSPGIQCVEGILLRRERGTEGTAQRRNEVYGSNESARRSQRREIVERHHAAIIICKTEIGVRAGDARTKNCSEIELVETQWVGTRGTHGSRLTNTSDGKVRIRAVIQPRGQKGRHSSSVLRKKLETVYVQACNAEGLINNKCTNAARINFGTVNGVVTDKYLDSGSRLRRSQTQPRSDGQKEYLVHSFSNRST